jgi:hypothetical protein
MSEYLALIETSQTHSRNVHQRFYVKKRRALEDASTIPIAYKKITPACPELENIASTTKYDDLAAAVVAAAAAAAAAPAVDPFDGISNSPIEPSSLDVEDPIVTVRVNRGGEFGSARVDFGIKGKRFPWIQEEIDYFHTYMADIEPGLEEEEKTKKYATCLKYIQAASPDVIKYFHPNHVENSDRIKTGYLKALESFRGDVM